MQENIIYPEFKNAPDAISDALPLNELRDEPSEVIEGANFLKFTKNICGIYKITSPSNRIYIGRSNNIQRRIEHCYKKLACKCQTFLYRSLVKYGYDNHKFEILEVCSRELLKEREIYYIKKYNTFNSKHGLNLTSGGEWGNLSDYIKKKISVGMMGNKNNLGKHLSEETKRKISIANSGINNGMYGKTQSEETIDKRRIKLIGRKMTEEQKKRMGDGSRGKVISEDTRIKMRISHLGHAPGNKGHRGTFSHSREVRDKISAAHKGRIHTKRARRNMGLAKMGIKNPMYGRKLTTIQRNAFIKKGKEHWLYGKHMSIEYRKKLSDSHKEYWKKKRLLLSNSINQ